MKIEHETAIALLEKILKAVPCSYIPSHTVDRLPEIIEGLVQDLAYTAAENDRLTSILDDNGIPY